MTKYVIAKMLKSGREVYYNSRDSNFNGDTFTTIESLSAVSMLLVNLVKSGKLDGLETTDVVIKEITLWHTKLDKE